MLTAVDRYWSHAEPFETLNLWKKESIHKSFRNKRLLIAYPEYEYFGEDKKELRIE
jgi:hypothetical protein